MALAGRLEASGERTLNACKSVRPRPEVLAVSTALVPVPGADGEGKRKFNLLIGERLAADILRPAVPWALKEAAKEAALWSQPAAEARCLIPALTSSVPFPGKLPGWLGFVTRRTLLDAQYN